MNEKEQNELFVTLIQPYVDKKLKEQIDKIFNEIERINDGMIKSNEIWELKEDCIIPEMLDILKKRWIKNG